LFGVAAAALWFFSYYGAGPVQVQNCSVSAAPGGEVVLTADLKNNSQRKIAVVYVFVWTGSLAEYRVRADIPNHWTRVEVKKSPDEVARDYFSYEAHLQPIRQCLIHAVLFQDGSHWDGGSPT
jgi:hypothetical protein